MIQSGKFDSSYMNIKKISNTALQFLIKRFIEIIGICVSLLGIFILIGSIAIMIIMYYYFWCWWIAICFDSHHCTTLHQIKKWCKDLRYWFYLKSVPKHMCKVKRGMCGENFFFICYDSHPFLDGKYTVWGKVIEGMNLIDRIPEGKGQNGQVLSNPTKIITIRLK